MTVLLTGATGFVGGAVLNRLLEAGEPVRALVRDPKRLPELPASFSAGLTVYTGSLDDEASLRAACEGVRSVIHLAGVVAPRRKTQFREVNEHGTARLAAAILRQSPACRWVQVSSLAAAGPFHGSGDPPSDAPVSEYGRSKLAGERALDRIEDRVVLRPPAVYGPRDTAFLPFFRSVLAGRLMPVPSIRGQRLSFVHVDDLATAIIRAAEPERTIAGEVLYPAHAEQLTLSEFLAALAGAVGGRARPSPVPAALVWTLAALASPWRALTGSPKYLSLDKANEIVASSWCCDPAGAEQALDWAAGHDLTSGLAHTAAAYRERGWLRSENTQLDAHPDRG